MSQMPSKIWLHRDTKYSTADTVCGYQYKFLAENEGIENFVEYIRTDAFIEKALKWYCLDCECNDNCKEIKCFFCRQLERYLKGEKNAIPPKFSDRILNEDGSTSENWRYRHFIVKMQDAFIEKAVSYLNSKLYDWVQTTNPNQRSYANTIMKQDFIEDFRNYMKGE